MHIGYDPMDRSMVELKEKFMRLLEADRSSREFIELFLEVDAELDAYTSVTAADVPYAVPALAARS